MFKQGMDTKTAVLSRSLHSHTGTSDLSGTTERCEDGHALFEDNGAEGGAEGQRVAKGVLSNQVPEGSREARSTDLEELRH